MNIVEAFIKFNGGIIIIISGLSGSGKKSIAKFIERDFKLKLINMDDFVVNAENVNTVELPNGLKILDWDDVDTYDWDKINKSVDDNKSYGVVVCGPYFPTDKFKIEADFHIQIKTPKQILIENRVKFINANKDKFKDLFKVSTGSLQQPRGASTSDNTSVDISIVTTIVNQITYPHFIEYTQKSKIDKYVNAKDLTKDQIYDQVADFLFFKINENLLTVKTNNKDKLNKSVNVSNVSDSSDSVKVDPNVEDSSESTSISDSNEEEKKPFNQFMDPDVDLESDVDSENKPIFIGTTHDEEHEWNYLKVGNEKYK